MRPPLSLPLQRLGLFPAFDKNAKRKFESYLVSVLDLFLREVERVIIIPADCLADPCVYLEETTE